MSRITSPQIDDATDALERQVEVQGEAAKQAIDRYKKSILPSASCEDSIERKREVEAEVAQYIKLRKRLDELRVQVSESA